MESSTTNHESPQSPPLVFPALDFTLPISIPSFKINDISPVEFPKGVCLPNIQINNYNYETGYEETHSTRSPLPNVFICSICKNIPRFPAQLQTCGHLFCEPCLKKQLESKGYHFPYDPRSNEPKADCALCKQHYSFRNIKVFGAFNKWESMAYKTITVKCPNDCGFTSDPIDLDQHQTLKCPKRMVKCPHGDCKVVLPAPEMETKHYPTCPELRQYCVHCNLPVKRSVLLTHNCLERLKESLKSMVSK